MFKLYNSEKKIILINIKKITYILNNQKKFISIKKILILKNLLLLGIINRKINNYYLSLPLNNQKTRTKGPKHYNIKNQITLYNFLIKKFKLTKIKYSKNFLIFDYINRLWYKQWRNEWLDIRKKRLLAKKITYRGRINVNFPILKYKHIIRNLKTLNKKKTKFLKHFNLGFFFYEYILNSKEINRFNKRVLKTKFSKYFKYRVYKKK